MVTQGFISRRDMDIVTNLTNKLLKTACSPRFRKLKASSRILKLAACFADYESDVMPPDSRLMEYPFVFSKIINSPRGRVLDIGCAARHNFLVPTLCTMGWEVWGMDIREWSFSHPNFTLIKGDIRNNALKDCSFDYVVCISTLEHIGLAGYYGVTEEDVYGDIVAGARIYEIIKDGGRLLLTVPYCETYSVRAGARTFDSGRLKLAFPNFEIKDKLFYTLNKDKWELTCDLRKEVVGCFEMVKI